MTRPGQATGYKIGQMKIRELRTKAETEMGERFNIKDFHEVKYTLGLYSTIPIGIVHFRVMQYSSTRYCTLQGNTVHFKVIHYNLRLYTTI